VAHRPIPPIAWVVAGGTGLALLALSIPTLHAHGNATFFHEGDATFYRAVALDPFGKGAAFTRHGYGFEIAYRYGRIGLPFTAWTLAFGRAGLIPWTLVIVNLVSIAAVPGLAVVLADEYGAPPLVGAAVLCSPLLFIRGVVEAEPLLITLILLAYVLESRNQRRGALVTFACAILVKESAVLALLPWLWKSARGRDVKGFAEHAATGIPYAAWCIVVRIRAGEFPFLARTPSRADAIGWPGAGIRKVLAGDAPHDSTAVVLALIAIALCCAGAFAARRVPIGAFAGVLAAFFLCLGPFALRYSAEVFRLLSLPFVFAVLCLAVAAGRRGAPAAPAQPSLPSSGARN
jgi:hypothetical protein